MFQQILQKFSTLQTQEIPAQKAAQKQDIINTPSTSMPQLSQTMQSPTNYEQHQERTTQQGPPYIPERRSWNTRNYSERFSPRINNFRPRQQFATRGRPGYSPYFNRRGTNLFCNFCKKPSHIAADCWQKQRRMREEQREQGSQNTNDQNTSVAFDPIVRRFNTVLPRI